MTRIRRPGMRATAAAVACAVHLIALAPSLGHDSSILNRGFGPQGEAIVAGADPYDAVEFEYPPLAIPVVALGAAVSDTPEGYREAFAAMMLATDLAIVLLLAAFASPRRRYLHGSLAVYTAGVLALTGIGPLPESAIEDAPLALARFDLLAAALALSAVIAATARRPALWGGLAGAGAALKGFPLLIVPAAAAEERRWRKVAAGAALALAAAAAILVVSGGGVWSAFGFHAERDLHTEAVAATPIELAHLAGAGASVSTGNGSFNLDGRAADVARALSLAAMALGWLAAAVAVLRRRPPVATGATALLAVAVATAPVLSPQFLLWLLPLSALAFGAGAANLVLLAAAVTTQVMLSEYAGVRSLEPGFVWTLAVRNALLVAYAVLVVRSLRDYPPSRWPARPSST